MTDEQRTLYGPTATPHHIWCNYAPRYGPCSMCDRLYARYPPQDDDTEVSLIKRHFPNVIVLSTPK